jgi:hypothetical protein
LQASQGVPSSKARSISKNQHERERELAEYRKQGELQGVQGEACPIIFSRQRAG